MIDPTIQCVLDILENNPDLARQIITVLAAAVAPGFKDGNIYDEIKDICFVKTQVGRQARDAYINSLAA